MTVVGLVGFILAGRKVWWAWYVNIGCQALWFIFGLVTAQYGFLIASVVYTFVFTQNAIRWTKARNRKKSDMDIDRIMYDYSRDLLTAEQVRDLIRKEARVKTVSVVEEEDEQLRMKDARKLFKKEGRLKKKRKWIATEAEAQEAYLKGIPPIQDTHLIVKNIRKH